MQLNNLFRERNSVVADEPFMEFDTSTSAYKLRGRPKRYQWLVEMLTVMFPQVEVRALASPRILGKYCEIDLLLKDTTGRSIIFHLYTWEGDTGKQEILDNPRQVARVIDAAQDLVESCCNRTSTTEEK